MANQTVVSAAAIWQGLFDTLTGDKGSLDFVKSGEYFYVEGNAGLNTNDGKSWKTAFKTLKYAINASNANIASGNWGYAARNKIFVKADSITEDLTVPPAKCDVIGMGSTNALNKTRIIGEWAWTGSSTYVSSGFYNLTFENDDTSPIFTVAACAGLYFYNCDFRAVNASEHGILLTTSGHDLVIKGCRFLVGTATVQDPFDVAAIEISATTFTEMLIENNNIEGDIGLAFSGTNLYNALVNRNVIRAVTFCIDDDTKDVVNTNNRCISAVSNTSNNDGILDWNVALAAGNIVTGSNHTDNAPALAE